MSTIEQGKALHQIGRIAEAEAVHRSVLARDPRQLLFLDNLPVDAHTAASDALWVGVPLLTCIGENFVGRVAASLLNAVRLPEIVTRSLGEYETAALKLARDPVLIDSIRQKLDGNRETYPLFNTDRLRRHIESAYMTMWDIAQRGEPPRGFAVEASTK